MHWLGDCVHKELVLSKIHLNRTFVVQHIKSEIILLLRKNRTSVISCKGTLDDTKRDSNALDNHDTKSFFSLMPTLIGFLLLGYLNDLFFGFKFKKIIKIVNDSTK